MSRSRRRRERRLAKRIEAANAPRKSERVRRHQLGTLGDVVDLSDVPAIDMQSPSFWRRVWE